MVKPRKYTYTGVVETPGDEIEMEVAVTYTVSWGTPESGNYGPPENYDPGSPDEIEDIEILTIDGEPYTGTPARIWVLAMMETYHEDMIDEAIKDSGPDPDDMRDRRDDYRRQSIGGKDD